MEFAKLCDHFKPTTLAAIVVDLGDGPFDDPLIDQIEKAQKVAMDALVANVGEVAARNMIEELEGQS
jgi:hypothetical protein